MKSEVSSLLGDYLAVLSLLTPASLDDGSTSVTHRTRLSLERLAEAHARMERREAVSVDDAVLAVRGTRNADC